MNVITSMRGKYHKSVRIDLTNLHLLGVVLRHKKEARSEIPLRSATFAQPRKHLAHYVGRASMVSASVNYPRGNRDNIA